MARRKKTLPGLNRHPKTGNWIIDKIIHGHGRFCRSTGTQDYAEAERRALKWIKEIEESSIHGKRTRITFAEAAAHYIDTETKISLDRDIQDLKWVMPHIGGMYLDEIHNDSFKTCLKALQASGNKATTINRAIRVVSRILTLAARQWRDTYHQPYLDTAPLINQLPETDKETTRPIEYAEELRLLERFNPDYKDWWTFATHTGLRQQTQIGLRWEWQVSLPLLNSTGFLIPASDQKNAKSFLLLLNSRARSIVERWQGRDAEWVFPSPKGGRLNRYNNRHFRQAREAAKLDINWHSARATFATRLRAAGVGEEDRAKLMGHESVSVTTQYSWADVKHLLECLELLCDPSKIDQMSSVFRVETLLKTHKTPQISRINKKGLAD